MSHFLTGSQLVQPGSEHAFVISTHVSTTSLVRASSLACLPQILTPPHHMQKPGGKAFLGKEMQEQARPMEAAEDALRLLCC